MLDRVSSVGFGRTGVIRSEESMGSCAFVLDLGVMGTAEVGLLGVEPEDAELVRPSPIFEEDGALETLPL